MSAISTPLQSAATVCSMIRLAERKCTRYGREPTVGDEVAAELAARPLDRDVDLAGRDAKALGDELEVVDERLHRRVQLVAWRQHDLAVVGDPRALGQPVERRLDDVERLADLVEADQVAVVGVAVVRQHAAATGISR